MSIFKEFRDFAVKGNVVELATAVIIGGAFGKIVTSVVNDIVMPPIGVLVGGFNFTDIKWTLKTAIDNKPAITMNIGNFLQNTIDFLIIAATIFIVIRAINRLNRKLNKTPEKPKTSNEEKLLTEIRDLLKAKNEID